MKLMRIVLLGSVAAVALVVTGVVIGRGTGADEKPAKIVRAPAMTIEKDGQVRTIVLSEERTPPASAADGLRLLREARGDDRLWTQAWLAKFLEENPERAAELLETFEKETDPEMLAMLAEALGSDPQVAGNPDVVRAMLRLAERSDNPDRRIAALNVLMRLPTLTPEATDTVLRIAKTDVSNATRIGAIAVVVDWMQTHPGERTALAREVADVARTATDGEVRGHAIQAIALQDVPMPADVIASMGNYLKDPTDQNRLLAAMALGHAPAEMRPQAVAALESAILTETSVEVRREMLIHVVRAGGAEAIPVLERLAPTNGDAADYLAILKSGVTDPIAVFERKQDLDAERGTIAPAQHDD